jgi:hypothetical protein
MFAHLSCPCAAPLEDFAAKFDSIFYNIVQRRGFREYLSGLLLPRDRPKTLTALAGAEPLVQAQAAPVQRLQYFLSEANWDVDAIRTRRLALLAAEPETTSSSEGVLVLDDSGDRKDGHAIDHVARQYLGSLGKVDNGIVAVTTLWANEDLYYPLHVAPYTPASRLAKGKRDPAFQTKPRIALELIAQAQAAGIAFRAIVADCAYGDTLEAPLQEQALPFVLARRGRVPLGWVSEGVVNSFEEAARAMPISSWVPVERRFRDGHAEIWWAVELTLLGYGPKKPIRAICASRDPSTLPEISTWYLTSNLPADQAPLDEIVRIYGLRNWVEQSYKQMKDELGWADFMVRNDRAIRRHWEFVCCAFCFCWWYETMRRRVAGRSAQPVTPPALPAPVSTTASVPAPTAPTAPTADVPSTPASVPNPLPEARKKNQGCQGARAAMLAPGVARGTRLVDPGALAHTLLERFCQQAPAT